MNDTSHSDSGNATRLITLHGDQLRYCHAMRRWLIWDKHRWAFDQTGLAEKLAEHSAATYLKSNETVNSKTSKFAIESMNAGRIRNALGLAQSHLAITPEMLDASPWDLNFLNGTVDLRSGKLRPHNPKDLITKLIHFDYNPSAKSLRWNSFLDQILGTGLGDESDKNRAKSLKTYIQKALGYSLTGSTREKCVFFLFGATDNGKSTMLTVFRELIIEYSTLLRVETLMGGQETASSLADLSDLRGARFAQTSETEQDQQLSQAKLKRICQGMGTVKACRKYENPIEFPETHKLWIDSNRRPKIMDGDDKATFGRLSPIEFLVTIPKEQQDRELKDKLEAEAEGILAWAVEGAKLWFEEGLKRPIEVEQATASWAAESNQLGRFQSECCLESFGFEVPAATLYLAYTNWTEATGEAELLSSKTFGEKMTLNFNKTRRSGGNFYHGIKLRQDASVQGQSVGSSSDGKPN
jgi:putative DNA primase/helicase